MPPSVHDNLLVSYEVKCEERVITLRTEYEIEGKPTEFTNVIFEDVQAYHFEGDAFGNIIFDVAEVPLKDFVKEHGGEFVELAQMNGRLEWTSHLESASAYLFEQGIKGFEVSSSLGLRGWVLAKSMAIVSA